MGKLMDAPPAPSPVTRRTRPNQLFPFFSPGDFTAVLSPPYDSFFEVVDKHLFKRPHILSLRKICFPPGLRVLCRVTFLLLFPLLVRKGSFRGFCYTTSGSVGAPESPKASHLSGNMTPPTSPLSVFCFPVVHYVADEWGFSSIYRPNGKSLFIREKTSQATPSFSLLLPTLPRLN